MDQHTPQLTKQTMSSRMAQVSRFERQASDFEHGNSTLDPGTTTDLVTAVAAGQDQSYASQI